MRYAALNVLAAMQMTVVSAVLLRMPCTCMAFVLQKVHACPHCLQTLCADAAFNYASRNSPMNKLVPRAWTVV